ncbi:LysR family transcriptional regulator [Streptomyces celluloflavus]|uniref:LysR family transcriptional regulator n=1 Tax=Streptomyces celluloflavus TaxID=58344 RepID=UPI0036DBC026
MNDDRDPGRAGDTLRTADTRCAADSRGAADTRRTTDTRRTAKASGPADTGHTADPTSAAGASAGAGHGPGSPDDPDGFAAFDGVELRHLRGFLAVADERSFTHAADRLRTGQPALTRTVRALETALGTRLLDRTTRRVELTDAGRRLYDDLAPLLPRLAAALRSPAGPAVLRLGFTSLLPAACAPLTADFEAATGAGVRLVRRDSPLAGLETGESDIVVLRGDIPPGAGLRTTLLLHEPRIAALSRTPLRAAGHAPDHPHGHPRDHAGEHAGDRAAGHADTRSGTAAVRAVARRRVLDWAELADLPLVVNTVTGSTTPGLWPVGRRPRLACTAGNFDEWLEAVAAGHGVGVAPEPVARRHTHPGIRYVRLKNAPPVPVHLALPARDAHPLAERLFALAERLAAPAPAALPGDAARAARTAPAGR